MSMFTKLISKLIYKVKIAFSSRDLFKNWIEILFKYVLSSLGLYRRIVKLRCLSGDQANVEPWIIGRILHNYYQGYIKNVKCANGDLIINDLVVTIKRGKYVQVGSVKFIRDDSMIYETFIKQLYSLADVNKKVVVDVGAYIGDSTIYFLLRGADKVIAIEPNPIAYEEMLENLRLNNFMDKVIPLNVAVSNKHDKICIHEQDINKMASTYYGSSDHTNCIAYVDALTLEDIAERYKISEGVLKMDCEGCEFTLLDVPCQILLKFAQIILEYHKEPYSLINHLKECGFKVNIIKPWRSAGIIIGIK